MKIKEYINQSVDITYKNKYGYLCHVFGVLDYVADDFVIVNVNSSSQQKDDLKLTIKRCKIHECKPIEVKEISK